VDDIDGSMEDGCVEVMYGCVWSRIGGDYASMLLKQRLCHADILEHRLR